MPNIQEAFGGNIGDVPGGLPSSRVGVSETVPRPFVTGTSAPATNTWVASAIYLPAGLTLSGITFFSAGTALGTGVHQWFGLWDKSLALLRGTADDTSTAWAADTAKRLALTSTLTTAYSGTYYLGLGITATTVPTLARIAGGGGAVRVLTPYAWVLDTTTAMTALANPLVQAAASAGGSIAPYGVLD